MTSLQSFIHRKVVILPEDCPAQVAAKAMRDHQAGAVLVTNQTRKIVGIVTIRDFACRWAADFAEPNTFLSKIMTTEVYKKGPRAGLDDVISLMEMHGIRRVPIISEEVHHRDQVIGMIHLDDLVAAGAIAPHDLVRIVKMQIGRRFSLSAQYPSSIRSQRRSEAHLHQTMDRFCSVLAKQTGLSIEMAYPVTQFLLGCLVMRVSATAAAHFMAQLPKLVQDQLLDLPPGPDRSTSVRWIVSELGSRFRLQDDFARSLFSQFLSSLQNLVDVGQIQHLKAQLPEDFKSLFPPDRPIAELRDQFPSIDPAQHANTQELQPRSIQIDRQVNWMNLRSKNFLNGCPIPSNYTGEGEDQSPSLEWTLPPDGTTELLILCEDPDSTYETSWTHWILYGIPPSVLSLPEGIRKALDLEVPFRLKQGKNSWGNIGYQGPMPPIGHPGHRYVFKVLALDRPISLSSGATRSQISNEIRGHILSEAELVGIYQHGAIQKTA